MNKLFKNKKILFTFIFLTILACDKGQPNHFEGILIDYDKQYNEESITLTIADFDEKSKMKIDKLESVEDLTIEFLNVLEELKFIYSGLLVLEKKTDKNSKTYKARLIINANLLVSHWTNLLNFAKGRYRTCDVWWQDNNIDNFKQLLYNQVAFQQKAENRIGQIGIEMMINYSFEFDDIDCNDGLSDKDKKNFREKLDNDNWVVKTNF